MPDERLPFGQYDDPDSGGQITITHSYTYDTIAKSNTLRPITSIQTKQKPRLAL